MFGETNSHPHIDHHSLTVIYFIHLVLVKIDYFLPVYHISIAITHYHDTGFRGKKTQQRFVLLGMCL